MFNRLNNKKCAFTLAEVLLVLAIVGVIATLMSGVIANIVPDKSKVMLRKAYNNLEGAVESLVNDGKAYGGGNISGTDYKIGDLSYTTATSASSGNYKFCYYVTEILDTVSQNCATNPQTFTTVEGNSWKITDNLGTATKNAVVIVDVNGTKDGGLYTFTVDHLGKITADTNAKEILADPYSNR